MTYDFEKCSFPFFFYLNYYALKNWFSGLVYLIGDVPNIVIFEVITLRKMSFV